MYLFSMLLFNFLINLLFYIVNKVVVKKALEKARKKMKKSKFLMISRLQNQKEKINQLKMRNIYQVNNFTTYCFLIFNIYESMFVVDATKKTDDNARTKRKQETEKKPEPNSTSSSAS